MAEQNKSWLRRRVETAMLKGFTRAYSSVRVDPEKFLLQLRAAYRVPISGYHGLYSLEIGEIDGVADSIIRSGMKMAAVEGAGFGLGGLITIIPDLGILSAITMRTIQKLSLLYGFEFNTDHEIAELWIAAASAAGVDISRELIEKEVVNKFVPRVIQRIAARASAEVVEKWAGRVIPLASSAIGAGLNYWFVRAWGERAKHHFRQRHLLLRERGQATQMAALHHASPPGDQGPARVVQQIKMPTSSFSCSAILFDLDGVLVDSTAAVDREWRDWGRRKGVDGNAIMAIAHGVRTIEVIRRVAPHLDAEREARKIENHEAHDHVGVVVMPGAPELVRSIPDGRWGVVTSGSRLLARARLRFCGLPIPQVLITSDDVTHGKPHPEPYLKGAERLGFDPSDCLVIEDAPAGIESARAGGMKVIGIASTYAADAVSHADAVIGKLTQIQITTNGTGKLVVEIR